MESAVLVDDELGLGRVTVQGMQIYAIRTGSKGLTVRYIFSLWEKVVAKL